MLHHHMLCAYLGSVLCICICSALCVICRDLHLRDLRSVLAHLHLHLHQSAASASHLRSAWRLCSMFCICTSADLHLHLRSHLRSASAS
jgi:hypothetical protein